MCGICGIVGPDGTAVDPNVLQPMSLTMRHRGPDADGYYRDGPVALGHRRLSVIDLPCGAQPMPAPESDDVVLTFSGEIYNFTELRSELTAHGHSFRTRSDTEVLMRSTPPPGRGIGKGAVPAGRVAVTARCCALPPRICHRVVAPAIDGVPRAEQAR